MKIKRFQEFENNLLKENTELINSILDKINDTGMDSLTDYEKSVLNGASNGDNKYETMEEDVNAFLEEKFGNLSVKNYSKYSFNAKILGYYFLDDENNLLLELSLFRILDEKANRGNIMNTLYVNYNSLEEIKDKYSLSDDDLDNYIKNWFMSSSYISEMRYNKELALPDNFEIKEVSLVFLNQF